MENQKWNRRLRWVALGIVIVTLVSFFYGKTTPLMANQEKTEQSKPQNSNKMKNTTQNTEPVENQAASADAIVPNSLDPVENENGLKATPKVLILEQNTAFPNLNTESGRNQLFSELIIPHPEYGALYEYVNEQGEPITPNSSQAGFQRIYVEITENYSLSSIRVAVPVTIKGSSTDLLLDGRVAFQVTGSNGKIILYPDDTKGKTESELFAAVKNKSAAKAWNTETGEAVPVNVVNTTINTETVGAFKADFNIVLDPEDEQEQAVSQKDLVVFGAVPQTYVSIAQDGTLSLGTNPTNLFSKFQTVSNATATNAAYQFVDEANEPITKFDTSSVGFHWAYVRMTDKSDTNVATTIKVPINVTGADTTALLSNKVMVKADARVILYPDEVKGKDTEELLALIEARANLKAWNTSTGEVIPAKFTATTAVNNSVGSYTGTITVGLEGNTATTTRSVTVFGADTRECVVIAQNATLSLSTTPTNLFTKFQTVSSATATNATYQFVNEAGEALPRFDTSRVGFQWAYVKMTDKTNTAITTTIKVPINVTNNDTTSLRISDKPIMIRAAKTVMLYPYPDDLKNKNTEQLLSLLDARSELTAWNMSTGEPIVAKFSSTTVVNNSLGSYKGTITAECDGATETVERPITVFGADPVDYATVAENAELELSGSPTNLFTKFQSSVSTISGDMIYQFVDEEGELLPSFDTRESGFHWAYVKITDRSNPQLSTIVPIPVTVTSEHKTTIIDKKAAVSHNPPLLTVSEIKGKTVPQIVNLLTEKLDMKAWSVITGEELDIRISGSTISQATRGNGDITLLISNGETSITGPLTITILLDEVIKAADLADWQIVPLNSDQGVVINPINGSKIAFPKRGLSDNHSGDTGFRIVDEDDIGYVYSKGTGRVASIPGVNGKAGVNSSGWNREYGLGWDYSSNYIVSKYFLRRENQLKEILIDQPNQIMYVYNLGLNRNLNFSVQLDMYNLAASSRSFSMLESVDTDYHTDKVAIYSLGNNSGFYMQPDSKRRFTIKLKDGQGNWLSDYQKYIVGAYGAIGVSNGKNYFNDSFTGQGYEYSNDYAGKVFVQSGTDSAYQLGAPWKDIAPNQALRMGYEVFAGNEIPYMSLEVNPNVFNVYQDHTDEFTTAYTLSGIPAVGNTGKIHVTYPNNEEGEIPFEANSAKKTSGQLTIPRTTLPEQLNAEAGTIKHYNTGLLAVNETSGALNGLPSNEYTVKINVYHLGATPIAQTVRKDSSWTKSASSIVKDPVILPGHKASYEYANAEQPVDTSVTGLQYAEVRMTDTDEPTQVTIIKVPVMVVEGTPPTSGLTLSANNFFTTANEVNALSKAEIDELILRKSEAIAWDNQTGLSTDIELSVTSTTLTNRAEDNEVYTATIQAKKGSVTKSATIEIKTGETRLIIHFLDEKGNPLNDPHIETYEVGDEVDLLELDRVKNVLGALQNENYQLVERPEQEVIRIVSGDNVVIYRFTGVLKFVSVPKVFDFKLQKAVFGPVRYTDPTIIGDPLVVSDTRADKEEWSLKAKVDQPLTSLEEADVIIPDAIKYNYQDDELLLTDEAVVIFSYLNDSWPQYNITTERWSKGDGFLLDLSPGDIKVLGKYQAKITITLENAR